LKRNENGPYTFIPPRPRSLTKYSHRSISFAGNVPESPLQARVDRGPYPAAGGRWIGKVFLEGHKD